MINKRKVVFLIPNLTGGGAERVFVTLLNKLNRKHFELLLIVVDLNDEVFLKEILKDVKIIDLKEKRVRYALPKIIKLLWDIKPDVLFTTLGHLNLSLAITKILLPRSMKWIARETNILTEVHKSYKFSCLWKIATKIFYKNVDILICQSHDMRNNLINHYNFPSEKTIIINNPINLDNINKLKVKKINEEKNPEFIHFISAGRLVEQKGFDILIKAIYLLNDKNIRVDIFGVGHLFDYLIKQIDKYNIKDQIRLRGFENNPYAWFARADAFILSSRYEGFPNVVLESLACGTPVIATPFPGDIKKLIGNIENCIISEEITSYSLMKAIKLWITKSRTRVDKKYINKYKCETIVNKYEKVLKTI